MRLNAELTKKIMNQNDGFRRITNYDSRNSVYTRYYTINGGKLHIREKGKTSWADSHYDKKWVADHDATRRFIHDYWGSLNLDGIEQLTQ